MTKEELLEKAKRDYPVGTEFYCAHLERGDDKISIVKTDEIFDFESSDSSTIVLKRRDDSKISSNSHDWTKCVWFNSKWAEIVSKPEVVEPKFEVGKWYRCGCNTNLYRFHSLNGKYFQNDAVINVKYSNYGGAAFGYTARLDTTSLLEYFSPNNVVTDLSEIQKYLPVEPVKTDVMKELTELPEKWFVRPVTIENLSHIKKYFNKYESYIITSVNNSYSYLGKYSYNEHEFLREGCTEITFDQFKKWVLKESDTLKIEDLVEGEIYFHDHGGYGWIFSYSKYTRDHVYGNHSISSKQSSSFYNDYGNSCKNISDLRKATDEEKQWLNASIKAGKFVSLEDSKKVVNPLEGRYIKCLNDVGKIHYPCHKGDYLKFVTSDGILEYWGAYNLDLSRDDTNNPRYFGYEVHKNSLFELMPVGFVPPVVTVKQDEVKEIVPEKGKWYEVTVSVCNDPQLSYIIKYDDNKYGDCEYISQGSYGGVGMFTNVNIVRELKSDDPQIIEPLLKYARMKYPVGCQIKSAKSGNKFEVSHKNTFITDGYLYYNGKWAEIVSLPSENTVTIESTPQEYNAYHLTPCSTMCVSIKENTSDLIDINFDIPIVIGE